MGELSDSQLLLLDNLIYLNGVIEEGDDDKTVAEVINDLKNPDNFNAAIHELGADEDEYVVYMNPDEWREILKHIENDPQLMNLKIKHGKGVFRVFRV